MDRRLLMALGIGAGAAGVGYLLSRGLGGTPLIIYQSVGQAPFELRSTAERLNRAIGGSVLRPAANAQQLYNAIASQEGRLGPVVLVGHGTPSSFFAGYGVTPDRLAQVLAPKLAYGSYVGLAGCRAGADPGEQDWGTSSFGPGGARGFAGLLRDALVRYGSQKVTVRAHSTTGHLTANPAARAFVATSSQVGRPGSSVIDLVWGSGSWQDAELRRVWTRQFRGKLAELWVSGEPLSRLQVAV
jgi:hypothetical protein